MTASPDVPAPDRPAREVPVSHQPPAGRTSRAGRDLGSAILVGLALGAIILVPLLTVRQTFVGVLAAATAVATWELRGALRRGAGIEVPLPVLLVGGQAMIWLSWPFGLSGLALAFAATALGCLVWRMRAGAAHYLRDVSAGLFTAVYVPLFCAFAAMLTVAPRRCRPGAHVHAVRGGLGRRRLRGRRPRRQAPHGPDDQPEEVVGGLRRFQVAGMATGALTVSLMLGGPWWAGALTGALLVISATLGDLVESLVKRDLGIKDMGNLLPGHGGLMDRLDSMLPTAVVSYFVLGLLVPLR